MSRFIILLGGDLTVTPRLKSQIAGSRVIAADGGMIHAAALRLIPELWVGDFDSSGSELVIQYKTVPRQNFPAEKDQTDGAIAVAEAIRRGATELILLAGLGGQTDHAAGLLGQSLQIARQGMACFLTSGHEEAWPLLPGETVLEIPPGTRVSLVPFSDVVALDLTGVKWPLHQRDVPLGSTLTLSNVATGPVTISIRSGYGIVLAYPLVPAND